MTHIPVAPLAALLVAAVPASMQAALVNAFGGAASL
jgi:hypothetical protein